MHKNRVRCNVTAYRQSCLQQLMTMCLVMCIVDYDYTLKIIHLIHTYNAFTRQWKKCSYPQSVPEGRPRLAVEDGD